MPSSLSSLSDWRQATNSLRPAVIEYEAPGCRHCAFLRPTFEILSDRHANELDFYFVDIEASSDIAQAANILSQPTVAVYSRGSQVALLKGAVREHLTGMVEATLEGLREANATATKASAE